ncbi:hypothetical protein Q757_09740 [Oenococcus alcoholitolerans]|uniref:Transmembrane protein n=1 Tax=Oenococcus alcoholitolerans TaxID=931074 RepID=A0ABR4XNP6_9LACO|nr:hypothetical protein Q757_09740 [Oenococcus alcoholitolerans]
MSIVKKNYLSKSKENAYFLNVSRNLNKINLFYQRTKTTISQQVQKALKRAFLFSFSYCLFILIYLIKSKYLHRFLMIECFYD